jgi:hypothetical protein
MHDNSEAQYHMLTEIFEQPGAVESTLSAPYLSLFRCGLARTAAHSFLKCVNSVCIIASETARPNRRGNWFAKTEIKPLFGTRCFRTAVCFFNTASSAFR